MTQIRFAVIDNKSLKKGHKYNIIYASLSFEKFKKYIKEKGLI